MSEPPTLTEEWKQARGVWVSSMGRVIDGNTKQPRMPGIGHQGYAHVQRGPAGKSRKIMVHRLVLEAFVGPCPDGMTCDHIDQNRANNRLSNLRWATWSNQNTNKTFSNPEKHGAGREVEYKKLGMEEWLRAPSIMEMCRRHGLDQGAVSHCLSGATGSKQHRGYVFRRPDTSIDGEEWR